MFIAISWKFSGRVSPHALQEESWTLPVSAPQQHTAAQIVLTMGLFCSGVLIDYIRFCAGE